MFKQLRAAIVCFVLLTILTGVIYPAVVTVIAKGAFASQSAGSIVERDGKSIGSDLIGQSFTDPKYFWPRPSSTADSDGKPLAYNGTAGTGSNLAPSNPALSDAVRDRVTALRAADPQNAQPVPVELVTASASGLDPHISVASANYQVSRVARLRNLSADAVQKLVDGCTEPRTLGFMGEPRINVLRLNLALDAITANKAS